MPFLPMDFLYCFHKMVTAPVADRLDCNIVAPISSLKETEESHEAEYVLLFILNSQVQ